MPKRLLIIASLFSGSLVAQEGLYDLQVAQPVQAAMKQNAEPEVESRSNNIDIQRFIYVVDTLAVPFFDDFTTNRIKKFEAKITDPNVSLKIDYDFKVNGDNPVSLDYRNDTTKSKVKTLSGTIEEFPNPVLYITFYTNGKPTGADTGWTNLITEFDQATGLVTYDTLPPDESLINTPDTFYRVADDRSLWIPPIDTFDSSQSAPFINNTYPKNPVTQGVATFDGTDRFGFPYDITTDNTFGEADMLLSKPIYLDSNMNDILLSFFYQAGGNGNMPDPEDSLILEFFDVRDSLWRSVWSAGPPVQEDTFFSNQVFIPVEGRLYLQSGFRFRFKNLATLSGSLDHWHLDYVRLSNDRDSTREDTVFDVSFIKGIPTFLENYIAIPYSHYLEDPEFFEADEVSVVASNLGSDGINMQGLRYEVFGANGNLIFDEVTEDPNIPGNTVRKTIFPITQNELFPDLNATSAEFDIQCRYNATGAGNTYKINDTIRTRQEFRNYYAYDDGSAEKAYALSGAGLKLAYEFNTPIGDTLHAIYINFPQILHDDNEDQLIEILVWDDLQNEPIYVAPTTVEPPYTRGDQFFRLKLDKPVFVENRFFIGFRQVEATKIYVGFDVNNNASSNIHYQINDTWYSSSFRGSLLMRPHFGVEDLLGSKEIVAHKVNSTIRVFPNPASSWFQIEQSENWTNIELYDLSGRLIRDLSSQTSRINTEGMPAGVYLIRAMDEIGTVATQKLFIRP